jgi:hypothetical protein
MKERREKREAMEREARERQSSLRKRQIDERESTVRSTRFKPDIGCAGGDDNIRLPLMNHPFGYRVKNHSQAIVSKVQYGVSVRAAAGDN